MARCARACRSATLDVQRAYVLEHKCSSAYSISKKAFGARTQKIVFSVLHFLHFRFAAVIIKHIFRAILCASAGTLRT